MQCAASGSWAFVAKGAGGGTITNFRGTTRILLQFFGYNTARLIAPTTARQDLNRLSIHYKWRAGNVPFFFFFSHPIYYLLVIFLSQSSSYIRPGVKYQALLPTSPLRFVPCIFIARRFELFLPSSTRVELRLPTLGALRS